MAGASVIILDTDHVNVLKYSRSPQYARLTTRLDASPDQDIATTVITVEEQLRGWLAVLNRAGTVAGQIPAYRALLRLVGFFARWEVLAFEESAAERFTRLRQQRLRIGTMDLKIASIALEANALLLSANLRDFQQVPDLQVVDWITS